MARIRTIKPEFWTDEKIVGLTPLARLLFIGLWNFVDDDGRAPFSPARLKMQILPADNADISEIVGEIRGAGLIVVYEVDGKEYFQVCGFAKHQKIDKRLKSKHPAPPNHPELPELSPTEWIKEGKGREKKDAAGAAPPTYFFESGVIRLVEKDFKRWEDGFKNLDLKAELIGLTQWANQQQDWFHAVAGALAKRNRAVVAARTAPKRAGIEGIV